jgi:uncharacterized protein YkwD
LQGQCAQKEERLPELESSTVISKATVYALQLPSVKSALVGVTIVAAIVMTSVAYVSSMAATVAPAHEQPVENTNGKQDQQVAQKIHQLVNEERAEHGLQPLLWDERIATFAEAHSRDIMARGSYSDSPDPKDKGDIFYKAIENAICVTEMNQQRISIGGMLQDEIARQAVSNWLADDYSRGNLLGPHDKEGIGVALGGEYGIVTQDLC